MECIMKNKNKKCFTFYVKYYWIPTEILQQLMLLLSYPKGYCTVHQKRCQSRVRGHLWQGIRLCHWGENVSRSVMSNSLHTMSSPPGYSVNGILWAKMLEQVVTSYSRGSFWPRDPNPVSLCEHIRYHLSHQGSLCAIRSVI